MAEALPSDTRRYLLIAVLALWVLAFGWSVFSFATMAPTGDGFTRGLNRVESFLGWQVVAALVATLAFAISRPWPVGHATRRIASVPFWIAVGEVIVLVALILSVRMMG